MDIIGSIVLFKNNPNIVTKAINSFLNTDFNVKLYLIDNSPTDNLRLLSQIDDFRIKYIFNNSNLGFGAGHNIAIKESITIGTKYNFIINPDICFDKGVIEELIKYMEDNNETGQLMPRIVYPDKSLQNLCKLLPSPFDLVNRRFLPSSLISRYINLKYNLSNYDYTKIIDVPNLSGCFMLFRTDILKQINGFDERFFMYLEDIDITRRAHNICKTQCYPFVSVTHEYAKESYFNSKLLKIHIISAIRYFNKWGWFFDPDRIVINKRCLNQL